MAAMLDIRTMDFKDGPADLWAELRTVRVPFMATLRMGSGSVKERETGEARWRIDDVPGNVC